MLAQDGLTQALKTGQATADCCRWSCRLGATVNAEQKTYALYHNGLGSRDTGTQTIHNPKVLDLSAENLAVRITGWLKNLHSGETVDMNVGG